MTGIILHGLPRFFLLRWLILLWYCSFAVVVVVSSVFVD